MNNIWFLYRITNLINNKVYIGQAADISKRWSTHRRAFKLNKPTQAIHHALIKYGLNNFIFETIACCKGQHNANDLETELVKQYDTFIGRGYNATLGGMNAPKSDVWKAHMSRIMKTIIIERLKLETPEQKQNRYDKVSNTMKGMNKTPGSGRKKGSIGTVSGNRKLLKEQVESIIAQSKLGLSSRKLAAIYCVNRSTISRILNGTYYKNF